MTGILSLFTTKVNVSLMPRRTTLRFTFVPFFPRRRRMMSSRLIFTPAMAVSLTATMRSPARMPTFSDGPLAIVWSTSRVS